MDALNDHLESLASLGTMDSHGEFSLSQDQVWERLRQALPDGTGSLRFLLRWLHSRKALDIAVVETKPCKLTITAGFGSPETLPKLAAGEELDFSGIDIDLARAAVGAAMFIEPMVLTLELDNGQTRYARALEQGSAWEAEATSGQVVLVATYSIPRTQWVVVKAWEQDAQRRFRCSPLPLSWNDTPLSGPYSFTVPVLVWRHLRRMDNTGTPLMVTPPRTAVESFRAARDQSVDVVLGMIMGFPSGDQSEFQLLRHGELLPLPQAERELAGFGGVISCDDHPLDLEGARPVWNLRLEKLVAGLKDEVVDMAIQLYRHEPPVQPREAEAVFLGMQSVLLFLMDHQRFTEGHLLAGWLREKIEGSAVLETFRSGYTFDKICSLLAEPAGQPQTSIRWNKHAEARVREISSRLPGVADEALLIAGRLEMRSRRDKPNQLSGDMLGRLLQLAGREKGKGRYREAADIYLMLGMSLLPGDAQRIEYLTEAAQCGTLAGDPHCAGVLAREMIARP